MLGFLNSLLAVVFLGALVTGIYFLLRGRVSPLNRRKGWLSLGLAAIAFFLFGVTITPEQRAKQAAVEASTAAAKTKQQQEQAAKERQVAEAQRKAEAARAAEAQQAAAKQKEVSAPKTEDATPPPTPVSNEPSYTLVVESWNCQIESDDYIKILGKVKNVSNDSLENVMAIGIISDSSGIIEKSDALIDYKNLRPGEISPFEVLIDTGGRKGDCELSFSQMFGDGIPTKFPN